MMPERSEKPAQIARGTMSTPSPLVIEMWAIVVTTKWQEGGDVGWYLHDGDKPWLFGTKEAAKAKAKECHDYRVAEGFPLAKYKPTRVRIAPAMPQEAP